MHRACHIPMLYKNARPLIRDGDYALCRPTSAAGRVIARRSVRYYSHASMCFWDHVAGADRLYLAEKVQWKDGRPVPFSGQVQANSGIWDIYRPPEPYDGKEAVTQMLTCIGRRYGRAALIRAMLRHVWVLKEFFPPLSDAEVLRRGLPQVCSQKVSEASRAGGFDPSPKPDSVTEPGDLAELTKYICTPYWKEIVEII